MRDIPVLTQMCVFTLLQPRIKEVPEPQVNGKRTNSLLPKIEFRLHTAPPERFRIGS